MTTDYERIAVVLAERFELRPRLLLCAVAFQRAVTEALAVVSEDELLDRVVEGGGLTGSHNPYAVVIARITRVPEQATADGRMLNEAAEARRGAQVDSAVHRGGTLRTLVARGDLFSDEAAGQLAAEFTDDDLCALALAALRGGAS